VITSITNSDLLNVLINRYLCVTRTMTAEFWTYSMTCPCEPITFSHLCARSGQHLSLSVSLLASHLLACPLLQPTPSALIFIKSESRLDTIAYRITCCVAVDRETFASYTKWSAMAVPPTPLLFEIEFFCWCFGNSTKGCCRLQNALQKTTIFATKLRSILPNNSFNTLKTMYEVKLRVVPHRERRLLLLGLILECCV